MRCNFLIGLLASFATGRLRHAVFRGRAGTGSCRGRGGGHHAGLSRSGWWVMSHARRSPKELPAGSKRGLWRSGATMTAEGGPAVLVAVDNCAVGSKFVEEVAARLNKKAKLSRVNGLWFARRTPTVLPA